jgi:DNA-binding NarL/FixJ family response regulator
VRLTLFLADDHAIFREGLRALFQAQADLQVVGEAADGLKTVELVMALKPDVVLMDVTMPGLGGIEATRILRQRGSPSRIIIVSMHSTAQHVYEALAAGANGYILKEAAWLELMNAIRAVCYGRTYLTVATQSSPLQRLSARERQVLHLVVEGRSSAWIAETMALSVKTVDTYRSRLMGKLGVKNVVELTKFALQHQITPST